MAFDQPTRNRLAQFVGDARTLLAEEFARQLQNDFGLDPSTGDVAEISKLGRIDDSRRETARLLRDTMEHYLAASSGDGAKARQDVLTRIVREQAFTVLNRLCAIRMAEARGLLIESVANAYQSKGFQLYARLAGTALGETGDAYRCYLFSLFDELTMDLPVLFDRFSAQGRLFPRESALLALLDLINHPEIEALWPEDETIGWVYQYFNSEEERRQMRAESQAPRNSRELAVRNQFFTPRYVVQFLTDNTLGRIWYEMTLGRTSLADTCRYLVRRPNEVFLADGESPPEAEAAADELSQEEMRQQPVHIPHRALKDPRDIRMLDPACGSMHFGLYAFDLFERIYDEAWDLEGSGSQFVRSEGLAPLRETYGDKQAFLREVPRLIIERNIHGIDIDPRAVQIAGLSLWLRAQRSWRDQGIRAQGRPQIQRSNIVCAEPMPGETKMLEEFAEKLQPTVLGELVKLIFAKMKLAGEAGSLLRIEEEIAEAIRTAHAEFNKHLLQQKAEEGHLPGMAPEREPTLFDFADLPKEDDFWNHAEHRVLAALSAYAEHAEVGGYQRRLFADDAARGFAFIDLARRRYDVVLMNPPFGDISASTKLCVEQEYPRCAHDLYPAFVERGIGLLVSQGVLGAITNRKGMLMSRFAEWRETFLLTLGRLTYMADLGHNVLDSAMVEVAAYCVQKASQAGERSDDAMTFISVVHIPSENRDNALVDGISSLMALPFDKRAVFLRKGSDFRKIPTTPFAYPYPPELFSLYAEQPALESNGRVARVTNQTSDDFRYLRLWWEVSEKDSRADKRWVPYAKGGEYAPYYADLHLVVDWDETRHTYNGYVGTMHRPDVAPASGEYFFRYGLTYTHRTNSAFAPRILPEQSIFANKGPGIFAGDKRELLALLGMMMSRVFQAFVELRVGSGDSTSAGTPSRQYDVGMLQSIPVPSLSIADRDRCARLVQRIVGLLRSLDRTNECSHQFMGIACRGAQGKSLVEIARAKVNTELDVAEEVLRLTWEIEVLSAKAYELSAEAYEEIAALVGPHPCSYPACNPSNGPRYNQAVVSMGGDLSKVVQTEVDTFGGHRCITVQCQHIDRRLETLAHLLKMSVSSLLPVERGQYVERRVNATEEATALVSYLIGCCFGRWNMHLADCEMHAADNDVFAPIPPTPPGFGVCGYSHDSRVQATSMGLMVDDPEQRVQQRVPDIVFGVRRCAEEMWGEDAGRIESEVATVLGIADLREYIRNQNCFFQSHLRRYSKSQRNAPIYWPLAPPSGSYTLWLYYSKASDQLLYTAINDVVDPKLTRVSDEAAQLRRRTGRSREDEEELERLTDLEHELTDFRGELLRIAKFWKPNLNDGVEITAAPLWKLFRHRPWQAKLKETWEALERGEYDWAHLAMSIWPARIVPKCVADRSLAIAHELEDLFWVEDDGRWRNLMEPEQEIEEQKRRQKFAARDRACGLLEKLAAVNGDAPANVVAQHLSSGEWDDQPIALLLWPERVLEECWHDSTLAAKHKIQIPSRRTQAAKNRLLKELVAAGCPGLACQFVAAFDNDEPLSRVWQNLAAGNCDHQALALSLWPDRVIDKCTSDAGLAEGHALAKYFWVRHPTPTWRRRVAVKTEIADEIARRVRG